jgi:hypothetical protein
MIDVTDGASIEHAVVEVRAVLDGRGLAGLVNNAGVGVAVPKNLLPAGAELRAQVNQWLMFTATELEQPP